jgi:hypothetical protein
MVSSQMQKTLAYNHIAARSVQPEAPSPAPDLIPAEPEINRELTQRLER